MILDELDVKLSDSRVQYIDKKRADKRCLYRLERGITTFLLWFLNFVIRTVRVTVVLIIAGDVYNLSWGLMHGDTHRWCGQPGEGDLVCRT